MSKEALDHSTRNENQVFASVCMASQMAKSCDGNSLEHDQQITVPQTTYSVEQNRTLDRNVSADQHWSHKQLSLESKFSEPHMSSLQANQLHSYPDKNDNTPGINWYLTKSTVERKDLNGEKQDKLIRVAKMTFYELQSTSSSLVGTSQEFLSNEQRVANSPAADSLLNTGNTQILSSVGKMINTDCCPGIEMAYRDQLTNYGNGTTVADVKNSSNRRTPVQANMLNQYVENISFTKSDKQIHTGSIQPSFGTVGLHCMPSSNSSSQNLEGGIVSDVSSEIAPSPRENNTGETFLDSCSSNINECRELLDDYIGIQDHANITEEHIYEPSHSAEFGSHVLSASSDTVAESSVSLVSDIDDEDAFALPVCSNDCDHCCSDTEMGKSDSELSGNESDEVFEEFFRKKDGKKVDQADYLSLFPASNVLVQKYLATTQRENKSNGKRVPHVRRLNEIFKATKSELNTDRKNCKYLVTLGKLKKKTNNSLVSVCAEDTHNEREDSSHSTNSDNQRHSDMENKITARDDVIHFIWNGFVKKVMLGKSDNKINNSTVSVCEENGDVDVRVNEDGKKTDGTEKNEENNENLVSDGVMCDIRSEESVAKESVIDTNTSAVRLCGDDGEQVKENCIITKDTKTKRNYSTQSASSDDQRHDDVEKNKNIVDNGEICDTCTGHSEKVIIGKSNTPTKNSAVSLNGGNSEDDMQVKEKCVKTGDTKSKEKASTQSTGSDNQRHDDVQKKKNIISNGLMFDKRNDCIGDFLAEELNLATNLSAISLCGDNDVQFKENCIITEDSNCKRKAPNQSTNDDFEKNENLKSDDVIAGGQNGHIDEFTAEEEFPVEESDIETDNAAVILCCDGDLQVKEYCMLTEDTKNKRKDSTQSASSDNQTHGDVEKNKNLITDRVISDICNGGNEKSDVVKHAVEETFWNDATTDMAVQISPANFYGKCTNLACDAEKNESSIKGTTGTLESDHSEKLIKGANLTSELEYPSHQKNLFDTIGLYKGFKDGTKDTRISKAHEVVYQKGTVKSRVYPADMKEDAEFQQCYPWKLICYHAIKYRHHKSKEMSKAHTRLKEFNMHCKSNIESSIIATEKPSNTKVQIEGISVLQKELQSSCQDVNAKSTDARERRCTLMSKFADHCNGSSVAIDCRNSETEHINTVKNDLDNSVFAENTKNHIHASYDVDKNSEGKELSGEDKVTTDSPNTNGSNISDNNLASKCDDNGDTAVVSRDMGNVTVFSKFNTSPGVTNKNMMSFTPSIIFGNEISQASRSTAPEESNSNIESGAASSFETLNVPVPHKTVKNKACDSEDGEAKQISSASASVEYSKILFNDDDEIMHDFVGFHDEFDLDGKDTDNPQSVSQSEKKQHQLFQSYSVTGDCLPGKSSHPFVLKEVSVTLIDIAKYCPRLSSNAKNLHVKKSENLLEESPRISNVFSLSTDEIRKIVTECNSHDTKKTYPNRSKRTNEMHTCIKDNSNSEFHKLRSCVSKIIDKASEGSDGGQSFNANCIKENRGILRNTGKQCLDSSKPQEKKVSFATEFDDKNESVATKLDRIYGDGSEKKNKMHISNKDNSDSEFHKLRSCVSKIIAKASEGSDGGQSLNANCVKENRGILRNTGKQRLDSSKAQEKKVSFATEFDDKNESVATKLDRIYGDGSEKTNEIHTSIKDNSDSEFHKFRSFVSKIIAKGSKGSDGGQSLNANCIKENRGILRNTVKQRLDSSKPQEKKVSFATEFDDKNGNVATELSSIYGDSSETNIRDKTADFSLNTSGILSIATPNTFSKRENSSHSAHLGTRKNVVSQSGYKHTGKKVKKFEIRKFKNKQSASTGIRKVGISKATQKSNASDVFGADTTHELKSCAISACSETYANAENIVQGTETNLFPTHVDDDVCLSTNIDLDTRKESVDLLNKPLLDAKEKGLCPLNTLNYRNEGQCTEKDNSHETEKDGSYETRQIKEIKKPRIKRHNQHFLDHSTVKRARVDITFTSDCEKKNGGDSNSTPSITVGHYISENNDKISSQECATNETMDPETNEHAHGDERDSSHETEKNSSHETEKDSSCETEKDSSHGAELDRSNETDKKGMGAVLGNCQMHSVSSEYNTSGCSNEVFNCNRVSKCRINNGSPNKSRHGFGVEKGKRISCAFGKDCYLHTVSNSNDDELQDSVIIINNNTSKITDEDSRNVHLIESSSIVTSNTSVSNAREGCKSPDIFRSSVSGSDTHAGTQNAANTTNGKETKKPCIKRHNQYLLEHSTVKRAKVDVTFTSDSKKENCGDSDSTPSITVRHYISKNNDKISSQECATNETVGPEANEHAHGDENVVCNVIQGLNSTTFHSVIASYGSVDKNSGNTENSYNCHNADSCELCVCKIPEVSERQTDDNGTLSDTGETFANSESSPTRTNDHSTLFIVSVDVKDLNNSELSSSDIDDTDRFNFVITQIDSLNKEFPGESANGSIRDDECNYQHDNSSVDIEPEDMMDSMSPVPKISDSIDSLVVEKNSSDGHDIKSECSSTFGKVSIVQPSVSLHRIKNVNTIYYVCSKCNQIYHSKVKLQSHHSVGCQSEKSGAYRCYVCFDVLNKKRETLPAVCESNANKASGNLSQPVLNPRTVLSDILGQVQEIYKRNKVLGHTNAKLLRSFRGRVQEIHKRNKVLGHTNAKLLRSLRFDKTKGDLISLSSSSKENSVGHQMNNASKLQIISPFTTHSLLENKRHTVSNLPTNGKNCCRLNASDSNLLQNGMSSTVSDTTAFNEHDSKVFAFDTAFEDGNDVTMVVTNVWSTKAESVLKDEPLSSSSVDIKPSFPSPIITSDMLCTAGENTALVEGDCFDMDSVTIKQDITIKEEPEDTEHLISEENDFDYTSMFLNVKFPIDSDDETECGNKSLLQKNNEQRAFRMLGDKFLTVSLSRIDDEVHGISTIRAKGSEMNNTNINNHSLENLVSQKPKEEKKYQKHNFYRENGRRCYPCAKCNRIFSNSGDLRRHIRSHTGEKPFKCSLCTKTYRQRTALKFHMLSHKGDKSYVCQICGIAMSQKAHMTCHMRTHTGERPFNCNTCGKGFSRKDHLNSHSLTHGLARPFKCHICPRAFKNSANLNAHIKHHRNDKRHKCIYCSAAFVLPCDLKRHKKIHDSRHGSVCPVCGKFFEKEVNLRRHFAIVHRNSKRQKQLTSK